MIKTWQVILATMGIFLAGLIVGGTITLRFVQHRAAERKRAQEQEQALAATAASAQAMSRLAVRPNPAGVQPQFGPQLIRRFAGQLDLSPEQTMSINSIVRRTVFDLNRLRRETQLSTALEIERMQDQIAGQLTPPQRTKFEELLSKQRARLQEFIEERNHRPKN